jgi:hypothetical protein
MTNRYSRGGQNFYFFLFRQSFSLFENLPSYNLDIGRRPLPLRPKKRPTSQGQRC